MTIAQPQPDEMIEAEAAKARTSERRNFFLSATLTLEPQRKLTARVRNLSAGGMMVEFEAAPDPELATGDRLVAELRNIGRVKCEIAWAAGRRCGIRFDTEIDPELARKPVTAGEGTPDYAKALIVKDRTLKRGPVVSGW